MATVWQLLFETDCFDSSIDNGIVLDHEKLDNVLLCMTIKFTQNYKNVSFY